MDKDGHNYTFAFGKQYGDNFERIFMPALRKYSIRLAEALMIEKKKCNVEIVNNEMLTDVPKLKKGQLIRVTVEVLEEGCVTVAGAYVSI